MTLPYRLGDKVVLFTKVLDKLDEYNRELVLNRLEAAYNEGLADGRRKVIDGVLSEVFGAYEEAVNGGCERSTETEIGGTEYGAAPTAELPPEEPTAELPAAHAHPYRCPACAAAGDEHCP